MEEGEHKEQMEGMGTEEQSVEEGRVGLEEGTGDRGKRKRRKERQILDEKTIEGRKEMN